MKLTVLITLLFIAVQQNCGFVISLPGLTGLQLRTTELQKKDPDGSINDTNVLSEETLLIQKTIDETVNNVFKIFAQRKKTNNEEGNGNNDFGQKLKEAIVGLVVDQFLVGDKSNDTKSEFNLTIQEKEQVAGDGDGEFPIISNNDKKSWNESAGDNGTARNDEPEQNVTDTDGKAITTFSNKHDGNQSTSLGLLLRRTKWQMVDINANVTVEQLELNNTSNISITDDGHAVKNNDMSDYNAEDELELEHDPIQMSSSSYEDDIEYASENSAQNDTEHLLLVKIESELKNSLTTAEYVSILPMEKKTENEDKWKFAQEMAMAEAEGEAKVDAEEAEGLNPKSRAHRYDTL